MFSGGVPWWLSYLNEHQTLDFDSGLDLSLEIEPCVLSRKSACPSPSPSVPTPALNVVSLSLSQISK